MHTYFAYGLGIYSTLPLPEFFPAKVTMDVVIHVDRTNHKLEKLSQDHTYIEIGQVEAILSLRSVGIFLIRNGNEITILPNPEVTPRVIRRYLIGTVMAILLFQRGLIVLHASSILINEIAVAFLGGRGSGKSSLAAALYKRGHLVITDDIAAIEINKDQVKIQPGFPQLKLNLNTVQFLGYNMNSLVPLDDFSDKYGFRFRRRFSNCSHPLCRIYLLDQESDQTIDKLTLRNAFIEIIKHSYPTRLGQNGGINHFNNCVQLAQKIPIYRIKRLSNIQNINETISKIEDHLLNTINA